MISVAEIVVFRVAYIEFIKYLKITHENGASIGTFVYTLFYDVIYGMWLYPYPFI